MSFDRMTRSRALASLGALAGAAALPVPTLAAETTNLKIGIVPTQVAAQGYFASDQGYFAKHGLSADIEALKNGAAVITAVLGGSLDLGYSNVLSFLIAHDKGLPVQALFGTDINGLVKPTNGMLCVAVASPIKTAKDLAGKTIGVSSLSNTNLYGAKCWIDKSGGDSKLSKFVEIPVSEMAQAVETGRIDAGSLDGAVYAPEASKLRMIGNTYLSIAPNYVAGVWFSTSSWITEHPALAQSFVASVREASIWANKNHEAALKIYSKYGNVSVADLQAVPFPLYNEKTQPSAIQPLIEMAVRYGAIKASFPAKDLLSVYSQ